MNFPLDVRSKFFQNISRLKKNQILQINLGRLNIDGKFVPGIEDQHQVLFFRLHQRLSNNCLEMNKRYFPKEIWSTDEKKSTIQECVYDSPFIESKNQKIHRYIKPNDFDKSIQRNIICTEQFPIKNRDYQIQLDVIDEKDVSNNPEMIEVLKKQKPLCIRSIISQVISETIEIPNTENNSTITFRYKTIKATPYRKTKQCTNKTMEWFVILELLGSEIDEKGFSSSTIAVISELFMERAFMFVGTTKQVKQNNNHVSFEKLPELIFMDS